MTPGQQGKRERGDTQGNEKYEREMEDSQTTMTINLSHSFDFLFMEPFVNAIKIEVLFMASKLNTVRWPRFLFVCNQRDWRFFVGFRRCFVIFKGI